VRAHAAAAQADRGEPRAAARPPPSRRLLRARHGLRPSRRRVASGLGAARSLTLWPACRPAGRAQQASLAPEDGALPLHVVAARGESEELPLLVEALVQAAPAVAMARKPPPR
jgi:hypothetical protein